MPPLESAPDVASLVRSFVERIPRLESLYADMKKPDAGAWSQPALKKTIERMHELSREGYDHAQFTLGEMYLTGQGLKRDPEKALRLLNSAALGGYIPAQLTLGMLAADGAIVERDLAEAHTWWAIVAEQGNKATKEVLPFLESFMSTRDAIEARKRNFQLRRVLIIIHGGDLRNASKGQLSERLRIAAALGDVEAVHVLLAQGADANDADLDGRTALIEAAWRGYRHIVKALIDNGANLAAADNTGKTALMWAGINGHSTVSKTMIDAGIPIDAQDDEGFTALMRAAWNRHPGTVKTLLAAKANADIKDKAGKTALDYAIQEGNAEVVAILRNPPPV